MHAPPTQPLAFPFAVPPPAGEVARVAPGVEWVRMPLPFALDHINLWVLPGPDAALVDCGYGNDATRSLWDWHFDSTLAGLVPAQIVATHFHPDHVGNAAWLAERFGCPVTMTLAEFLTGHAVLAETPGFGPADTARLFRAHGMPEPALAQLAGRGNTYRRGVPTLPGEIRRTFGGEELSLGSGKWTVIAGYGHSAEHAALYCPALGVLISGDMLLPRISTNVAVWASEPDADPLERFLRSLEAFEALPDDTLVLPSHGLPFRGIRARVAQLRDHHRDRLAELAAAVRQAPDGAPASDVVPVLFRRPLDVQQQFFAMGEAIAHLNHLWHRGTLERRPDAGHRLRFALAQETHPA
jgi:glyoxylase-like metal-dependent hydrolase (beta-lactamase superfamily II)